MQISNISSGATYSLEALHNGGMAVYDFKGLYLTQNYDLPRKYA